MQAMLLDRPGPPLRPVTLAEPSPRIGHVAIDVSCCGVCRTDLHVIDGELSQPKLPLVIGHQIVGRVAALGPNATRFAVGARVGVP